tara:strand:+ start:931 stop:2676 length:1746 start_codon:yes stop_codon:yes gene_type:complete
MLNNESKQVLIDNYSNNEEINFNLFFKFLFRNKRNIGLISLIFFVLACIYSLTLKKIWSGQFQIVLNEQNNVKNSITPSVEQFLNRSSSSDLKTQVGILKSPSILNPIYEFVLNNNKFLSKNENLIFSKWKKNLDIKLERGTSILNISYQDKDKEIVLPVLNKITLAYQNYSQKNKKRSQELTKDYLIDQISIFKQRSSYSLKEAQEYAIDQDLIFFQPGENIKSLNSLSSLEFNKKNNFNYQPQSQSQLSNPNTGIIGARVRASNQIRKIDEQIKKIEEIENDFEKIQYIGSTIPGLVEEGLPKKVSDLNQTIAELKKMYTQNDPNLLKIIDKRNVLIDVLKKRIIGILQAQKIDAEAIMKASMRPKGVLLRYKELVRNAARDESTLISLENELRFLELEEAKSEDPWQLITNPTLLKNPIGPSRTKVGLIGLISGFLFGLCFAFYKERKSNKIFELEGLMKVFSPDNVFVLNDFSKNNGEILYLIDYLSSTSSQDLFLINLGINNNQNIKKLTDLLIAKSKSIKNIDIISSFPDLINCTNGEIIIYTSLEEVFYSQIDNLKKYIQLFDLNVKYIIFDRN